MLCNLARLLFREKTLQPLQMSAISISNSIPPLKAKPTSVQATPGDNGMSHSLAERDLKLI